MTPQPHRKDFDEHTFDLVVVGGGLAGLCAALAAARGGTRTAIVQDRPMFGGNSSSEVRVVPHGASHGAAWGAETGIVHELILADRATNHESFFDHGLINSLYDLTLFEAARSEPLLTTFMNTSVRGVLADDLAEPDGRYTRRVVAVHGSQLGSEKELLLRARQFVDASGDGTVGSLAGAEHRYGRESRATFGEPLAPAEADETTLGSTITMRAKKIDRPAPYTPPAWIARYTSPDDFVMDRRLYHIEKEQFGGYWWLEVNNPFHQIDDYEAIRDELHRHVLGVWNYLKNHSPEKERFTNYVLEWIGQIPGKRESRRFVGDVTVTEQDCHADRRWPDGVAYASWWIDLHIKGGINNREAPGERENIDKRYSDYIRVVPFSLPLRAFYSRNVENLWLAGRIYSVSHIALGPVRVQQTLAAAGQAVGLAAAHALRHGVTPRALADPDGPYIQPLRQDLLRHDARLLGVRNTDPTDLARTANVTASSSVPLALPDPIGLPDTKHRWQPLDTDRAQVVPLTTGRVDEVAVYLRHTGDTATEVTVELEELQRIWDREHGKPVASAMLRVPPGHEGWLAVPLDAAVTPDRPHRVILRAGGPATADVAWATATPMPVGTVAQYLCVSPGGPEDKNAHLDCLSPAEVDLPAYELWRQFRKGAHGLRLTPEQRPYEARYAVNGAAWPEDLPNLWASAPIGQDPEWLRLDWPEPVTFRHVRLSFDTDLDAGCDKRPGFYRAPQCARDWRLAALVDGEWTELHRETGNIQRHRVVRLHAPVTTTAVRVEIHAVHDDTATFGARIFEVRVHAD
ncbi:FAD dependent oxidoreductase [Micromonospora sediminicola]|uniref:FAD dependent oxidoreductase n=1 Tax=Micromonospora sediminicola TaxID=946078 RepID=A0A1A9B9L6_9ACTN|nr:FAD-dependent oxidoreductase [Micromonospora sediminicola]SBT65766.1 FAD dependent oxidoreductase [Micromonospora sediminicola]